MNKLLTPRQVAESLGVSESSLKRWCDQGMIDAVRTPGGHRKLPFEAVMRFLRDSERPLVKPGAVGLPENIRRSLTLKDANAELQRLLLAGDVESSRRLNFSLYLSGHSIATMSDQVFAPVMQRIGEQWECGDVEVYQEHRAVEILVVLLHDLRLALSHPPAAAPMAIGGSIEGDCYDLPTRMIELTMRELGWHASSLGSSLPMSTLAAAVRVTKPTLVWLSIATLIDEGELAAQVNGFFAALPQSTRLVIGGRAVTPDLRRQLRATAFCDTMQQLTDFAATIHDGTTRRPSN